MQFGIILAYCLLMVSCGSLEFSKTSTSISDSNVDKRIGLLNKKFSESEICRDYSLAQLIIKYLHNDSNTGNQKIESDCPIDYRQFANQLINDVNALNDLHSAVLVGYGLDGRSMPVVTRCMGANVQICQDSIGSLVQAVPSPSEERSYIAITDKKKKIHFVKLDGIDGHPISDIIQKFKSEILYSHTSQGFSEVFVESYLTRRSFDTRSKAPIILKGTELATQMEVEFELSYDAQQVIFNYPSEMESIRKVAVDRGYGCSKIYLGSNYDFGACIDDRSRPVMWLSLWPQRGEFLNELGKMVEWIGVNSTLKTITFDLRGNGGGSTESVIDMVCAIGDKESIDAVEKMQLDVRYVPEFFELGDSTIYSRDLKFGQNLGLKRIKDGFRASANNGDQYLSYKTGMLEKSVLTRAQCEDMNITGSSDWNWTVLTNGREFSATEDFLFIVSKSKRFVTFGKSTVGGSGNPWWIELPSTKAGIRISPARDVFDGNEIIEKIGIYPSVFVDEWESHFEFETRLRSIENGQLFFDPTRQASAAISRVQQLGDER
jgi:hypothetical protein